MKTCRGCGAGKDLGEFYAHPRMGDGRLNFCKECVKARVRQHRHDNDHVRDGERLRYADGRKREQADRWKRANAERMLIAKRASSAINNAIRDGRLMRPNQCEECGVTGNHIEGAHWDYSRPMDVRWLCRRCHRRWDAESPKSLSAAPAVEQLRLLECAS